MSQKEDRIRFILDGLDRNMRLKGFAQRLAKFRNEQLYDLVSCYLERRGAGTLDEFEEFVHDGLRCLP